MEGMNNDMLRRDEGLRRALARREGRMPKMSADLNERLMERMEKKVSAPTVSSDGLKRRWMWGVAASIAMVVVLAVAGMLVPSSSPSLSRDSSLIKDDSMHRVNEVAGAAEKLLASNEVTVKVQTEQADTLLGRAVKTVMKMLEPKKTSKKVEAEDVVTAENTGDTLELTSDQRKMASYVAQLAQMYHAQSMPLDCQDNGKGKIYIFQEDKETDILALLNRVVVWLDTDNPSVRMSYTASQMTLELDGDSRRKEANEVWLADRRDGRIYLYHSQSAGDEWASAGCYMDFLAVNTPHTFLLI